MEYDTTNKTQTGGLSPKKSLVKIISIKIKSFMGGLVFGPKPPVCVLSYTIKIKKKKRICFVIKLETFKFL
jgi:hypothetical protein